MGIKLYRLDNTEDKRPQLVVEREEYCPFYIDYEPTTIADGMDMLFDIRKSYVEYVYVIGYNYYGDIIGVYMASKGDHAKTESAITEIFITLLLMGASCFVLIHNHPEGTNTHGSKPSQNDIIYTKQIAYIASILKLDFIDHCIILNEGVYSFKENNLL